jgi:hypothetical protein
MSFSSRWNSSSQLTRLIADKTNASEHITSQCMKVPDGTSNPRGLGHGGTLATVYETGEGPVHMILDRPPPPPPGGLIVSLS